MYFNSNYLVHLILQEQNQSLENLLKCISCGLYSKSSLVVEIALKLVRTIMTDLKPSLFLRMIVHNWMLDCSEQGGCTALNYVIKKKPEFIKKYLDFITEFFEDIEQIKEFILEKSMNCIKDLFSFFNIIADILIY